MTLYTTEKTETLIAKNPWWGFQVPEPPDDAPREQVFEFGALAGLGGRPGYPSDIFTRCVRLYCEKWHPDMELPK